MREEIVEFGADVQDSLGGVLGYYLGGDDGEEGFPVRGWEGGCVCYFFAGGS